MDAKKLSAKKWKNISAIGWGCSMIGWLMVTVIGRFNTANPSMGRWWSMFGLAIFMVCIAVYIAIQISDDPE